MRGQNPKSDIWDMAGKVADVVHGERAVFVSSTGVEADSSKERMSRKTRPGSTHTRRNRRRSSRR